MANAHGLTAEGVAALDARLGDYVEQGYVPGLVALVACGRDVHVTAIGRKAFADPAPMGADTIFRIASITKPIVGAAAALLLEDGAMKLDDPVDRWIPELANRRVLRTIESALDDTVPAGRPITVEDVLSFRLGFGLIPVPGDYPIQRAERELVLNTLGPPWPPTGLAPDEWIARFATLPLMDQPGAAWRYNTGATVAGVLVGRVAGEPLPDVLAGRVLEPLGMADTGFFVPEDQRERFTVFYTPDPKTGELRVVDEPNGWWSAPPALPDGSAGLVSTAGDLWAFARMLAEGRPLLSPQSIGLMLRDRTTARDRFANRIFLGEHSGWGLMLAVPAADGSTGVPGGYGWEGGSGTSWRTDPVTGLTGILLTQRELTSPKPPPIVADFWTLAYAALRQ
jgi:CubicO group peptidase (beta-lactamase class C family)